MSRNGSGTYAVPNTFTPNTTMSATDVNSNFSDAGAEITNSLARDGQSVMTGQFKAADGSASAPSISFGADLNTGFYRSAADEISAATGGTQRLKIDSAGKFWALYDFDIAGALNLQGALSGSGVADLAAIEALSSTGAARRTGAATWSLDDGTTGLVFIKDGYGSVIPTGIHGDISCPFAATITGYVLLADQSGSISLDLWKTTYSSFDGGSTHPVVGDSIVASAPPAISSATKATDTTLTGWTKTISAGDIIRINCASITSITRYTLILKVKRFT